ncbi:hemerythrin domain-containing protein [Sulfitobacter pacificus]|uniref:hemerythrin domain-containing protein n=1 Tax=Sulfitobacter pacificus TaxID=1499314 RepID=UPI003609539D
MQPSEPMLRGSGDKPTSPSLLANPLDFISEDHLRERQVCAVIDGLATADTLDRQATTTVLRFLNEELNVHLRDEAEDLFPLLARRCTEEDAIEGAINRIRADQDEAMRLLPEVRAMLAGCLDRGRPDRQGARSVDQVCGARAPPPRCRKRYPLADCPRPADPGRSAASVETHAVKTRAARFSGDARC